MHLELSSEQTLLCGTVERWVAQRVAPHALAAERDGHPPEVYAELTEMGLWGLALPESAGGSGLGALELVLVGERLARGDAGFALGITLHNAVAAAGFAPAAHLDALAAGAQRAAWGERTGPHEANPVLGPPGANWLGVGAFGDAAPAWVDAGRSARELTASGLGVRTAGWSTLRWSDEHAVPRTADLGWLHLAVAAVALGLGRAALARAVTYAKERRQFGRPIADFQAIQFKLADSATELEAAAWLTYAAAQTLAERPSAALMAQRSATQAAVLAADHALQIHGGYGYVREFEVERLYRDALLLPTLVGGIDGGRTRVARQVLGPR